jgi:hypothetical protein
MPLFGLGPGPRFRSYSALYRIGLLFLGSSAVLAFSFDALAETYYVDAMDGRDTNNGLAEATAWKTIAKVNASTLEPGDQILFKRGRVWREVLRPGSSGTRSEPIVFGAYDTGDQPIISGADLASGWECETTPPLLTQRKPSTFFTTVGMPPNQVFQDGVRLTEAKAKDGVNPGGWYYDHGALRLYLRTLLGDEPSRYTIELSIRDRCVDIAGRTGLVLCDLKLQKARILGIHIRDSSHHVVVSRCCASGNYTAGIFVAGGTGVADHVTIDHCTISDNAGSGILGGNRVDSLLISDCEVYGNSVSRDNEDYEAGVYIVSDPNEKYRPDNVVVQSCNVHDNGLGASGSRGYGIWLDTVGRNCEIRFNRCHDNRLSGINLEWAGALGNAKIIYNIAYNNGIGIMVYRRSHGTLIANNVMYWNEINLAIQGEDNGADPVGMHNNGVVNNIASSAKRLELRAVNGGENNGVTGKDNFFSHNSFGPQSRDFIEWGAGTYESTYVDWEKAYGSPTYSINADPMFSAASQWLFTLQPVSPCLNTGVNLGLLRDYAGNPIPPIGESVDVGAFQHQRMGPPKEPQHEGSIRVP